MTPPNFGLYLTCLLMSSAASTALRQQSMQFEPSNVGANVTLRCLCVDDVTVMFYWYKQSLGQIPTLVSSIFNHRDHTSFHGEFKKNSRFSLDSNNKYLLKISDLQISDSATYYCVKSNLYDFVFCDGITVIVKEVHAAVPAVVHQSASGSIQPRGSVTLNCTVQTGTCDGRHSVYWFRDSGEAHPGIIYTHGDRNDQCERKPDTQTHTCVYNLPLRNLNGSDAGTYYCAVASCGRILFGNGTKLDFVGLVSTDAPDSAVLVYVLGAMLAFTTSLVAVLAFSVYKMCKGSCPCTEPDSDVTVSPTANAEGEENLHYAALRDHQVSRSRKSRDETMSDCVYSRVNGGRVSAVSKD